MHNFNWFILVLFCGLAILTSCVNNKNFLEYTIHHAPCHDFAIVNLQIPYYNQSNYTAAHLWEHLVLRKLRRENPQYLFAGQTCPDKIILECTTPKYDSDHTIALLLHAAVTPDRFADSIACEKKLIALEQAQFSSKILDNDVSLPTRLLDTTQYWRITVSSYAMIPSHHRPSKKQVLFPDAAKEITTDINYAVEVILPSSTGIKLFQSSAIANIPNLSKEQGHLLTMYLTRQLYQTWITTGYAYQASAHHDTRTGQLRIWVVYDAATPKPEWASWLQSARYQHVTVDDWHILEQRAWLYARKNRCAGCISPLYIPAKLPQKQKILQENYLVFQKIREYCLDPNLWQYSSSTEKKIANQ